MSVARDKLAARVAPAALVALTLTALAPYAPYCDWLGDEGAWLWGAENLLGGRHFRIGMFALNPLIYLVTAGWMEVFGRSFLSIRALCAAVVVGIALGIYATALRLGVRRSVALGVSSLWVLLTQGNWTTVSHHWLSALFAISALCAAVTPVAVIETQVGRAEAATGRAHPMLAGALAACAVLTTPNVGVVAALAIVAGASLSPSPRARIVAIATGALGATVVVMGIAWLTGLITAQDFAAMSARYARFAPSQRVAFGAGASRLDYLVMAIPPISVVGLLVLAITARRARGNKPVLPILPRGDALMVALAAVLCPLCAYPRPDAPHLEFRLFFALPALCVVISSLLYQASSLRTSHPSHPWFWALSRLGAASMMVVWAMAAWTYAGRARAVAKVPVDELPRGRVAFGPIVDAASLRPVLARIETLPPNEQFLFYPYAPMLPYLLNRRHVAPTEIFTVGYLTPEEYLASCEATVREADWVLIDRRWSDPSMIKAIFPNLSNVSPPEKERFEHDFERNSDLAMTSGTYELRKMKPRNARSACTPVPRSPGG